MMLKKPAKGLEKFIVIAESSKEPIVPTIVVICNFQKGIDLKCACSRYAVYHNAKVKKINIMIGIIMV